MKRIKLGCIADDFTGATDLANNLVRSGMRVLQYMGTPSAESSHANDADDADAIVIALKSRTIEPSFAVAQSITASRWLCAHGAEQIYFKYCSTFDSTPKGNIGPVLDALLEELDTDFAISTPAFPDNQRTVFMGHLFVGDVPLHESGMRNHPLTPMTDSNLVRVLQAQTKHKVGLVPYASIAKGGQATQERFDHLKAQGVVHAIADAVSNSDLMTLGKSLAGHRLVSGGSGIAIGLPQNWSIAPNAASAELPRATGATAIISGSCSQASNAQVADFIAGGGAAFAIDGLRVAAGDASLADDALAWASPRIAKGEAVLVYSTATPETVRAVQQQLGVAHAGELIEQTLAQIAKGVVELGVGQLIVAGGETSGACTQALGIESMRIGAQIDPGVPWCHAVVHGKSLHIALKSGNFGSVDFFTKAFVLLR
jgi:3-dehydrotetronate 4-kinase